MNLGQLSRVVVQFSPWTGNARSAREFLSRVTSRRATESNPSCEIKSFVRVEGDPFVEITYENKKVERILTKDLTVQQILNQIGSVAEQMDTLDKLKAAGLDKEKIDSQWQSGVGRETELGVRQNIPRQA